MSNTLKKCTLTIVLALLNILAGCSRCIEVRPPKAGASLYGTVIRVSDGDTLTILDANNTQHRVRLKGIDAPERRQDFYQISRDHLAHLVFQKQVRADYQKIDRYCRLVATVRVNGTDASFEQLKAGLAWHFKEYEKEQSLPERQSYASTEEESRRDKRGLWIDPKPIPPWVFRNNNDDSPEDPDTEQSSAAFSDPQLQPESRPLELGQNDSSQARRLDSHAQGLGSIRGNKRSRIYHWPGCPNYDDIAIHNRVPFKTREEAESAGYRAARNCP